MVVMVMVVSKSSTRKFAFRPMRRAAVVRDKSYLLPVPSAIVLTRKELHSVLFVPSPFSLFFFLLVQ